jgi:hypothetical protein
MGILLSGRYGHPPEAESGRISLSDCVLRLGLKPSDFISQGEPVFFEKAFGTRSRYLLFKTESGEAEGQAAWKSGYYLLPLEAAEVLAMLEKNKQGILSATTQKLPYEIESEKAPPADVLERTQRWADQCQPLFFKCQCVRLELRLDAPWGLRRRWRVRLRCPGRCQPAMVKLI